MPVPPGPGPHRETHQVGPWRVDLCAHQGKVRPRIEDAWATVAGARVGDRTVDAFTVFDGLGGVPHGQQAAWAAADGLRHALDTTGDPGDVLRGLNDIVRPTGGSTTAVVLLIGRTVQGGHHEAWLHSVGDSSAYAALEGAPFARLNPHDRRSRHVLSDWLGRPAIGGHLRPLRLAQDDVVVLCTDGADEILGVDAIRRVAEAGSRVDAALEALFAAVLEAGAPDNATVMVVRRADP